VAEKRAIVGTVVHHDLTVADANTVRDFYAAVVGWNAEPLDMGGYADYVMAEPATGAPVAGVCHARGGNASLPPVWLAYVAVADLDAALRRCGDLGGAVAAGPFGEPGGRYAVIGDPIGVAIAVIEASDTGEGRVESQPSPEGAGPRSGTMVGIDLTVPDPEQIRDFYASVMGWTPRPVDQGGYVDYEMTDGATGSAIAGICHARGANAGLPPVWLPYVAVDDLDGALRRCTELGGSAVAGPFGDAGSWRYAVIRDPAGAHLALSGAGSSVL
jgi:hypothetical protein